MSRILVVTKKAATHEISVYSTNFPKDGQRITVIGTNKIVKLTMTRWPCRGTIQRTTAL